MERQSQHNGAMKQKNSSPRGARAGPPWDRMLPPGQARDECVLTRDGSLFSHRRKTTAAGAPVPGTAALENRYAPSATRSFPARTERAVR